MDALKTLVIVLLGSFTFLVITFWLGDKLTDAKIDLLANKFIKTYNIHAKDYSCHGNFVSNEAFCEINVYESPAIFLSCSSQNESCGAINCQINLDKNSCEY